MRLDLLLRVRQDRFNLAIRLRVLAGAAAVASVIVLVTQAGPADLVDLRRLPLVLVMPGQMLADRPPAASR
jgi:hypothetical protein